MALSPASSSGGSGGISVTDGSHTVDPATELDVTSGGTVTDAGAGIAQLAIAAAGLTTLFDSTLGADAATIDTGANGIAGGHTALLILLTLRTAEAGAISNATVRFNNDSGANYDSEGMSGNNITLTADGAVIAGTGVSVIVHGSGGAASYPSTVALFIPAYAATTFFKSGAQLGGAVDQTAANFWVTMRSFAWRSAAAISRASVTPAGGANLKAGSRMTVLGLG